MYRCILGKSTPECQSVIPLSKPLEMNLVFSYSDTDRVIVCEILRRKGDYLSFLGFYAYAWRVVTQAKSWI